MPAPPQSPDSAGSGTNEMMNKPFAIDGELLPMVEKLMGSLVLYKVVGKDTAVRSVKSSHIYDLAKKTGIPAFDPTSNMPNTPMDLLQRLVKFGAFSNVFHRKLSFMDRNVSRPSDVELQSKAFSEKVMFPGTSAGISSTAVIYMSRTTTFTPDARGRRSTDEKKKSKPRTQSSAGGGDAPEDDDEGEAAPTKVDPCPHLGLI